MASLTRVWEMLAHVPEWPAWNAGIESIALHGPFAVNTTFPRQLPGGPAITTLVAMESLPGFSDQTWVETTRVVHRQPLSTGGTRITYTAEVHGPEAEAVGQMVTADFAEVLAGLRRLAEGGWA